MNKIRNKKGFSLVEAVIALSVIVAVSVTALTIMLSSITARENAVNKFRAQSFAESVWESFKSADTQSEFLSDVFFAEGVMLTDGVTDENDATVYTYVSEKNKFEAEIRVSYPDDGDSELNIAVSDEDGDEIISFSYRKGGGI